MGLRDAVSDLWVRKRSNVPAAMAKASTLTSGHGEHAVRDAFGTRHTRTSEVPPLIAPFGDVVLCV